MQRFQYIIVLFFLKLSKIIPQSALFGLFNALGILFFYALKSRRNLTIKNLSLAYPDKTKEEIYALAKACFKSVSRTTAEILLIFNYKKTSPDFIINKDEVIEQVRRVNENNKNGMIFLTAHFGNWEILADMMALEGFPLVVIGREGDNKLIEANLTKVFRERHGNKNAYKKEAMSKMVKTLKNGGNVGLLIDQKAGVSNSVEALFFAHKCSTTISVATMKLKYNSLVVPLFAVRQSDGRYRVLFEEANYEAEDKASKEEKIAALTQYYNDILERAIRTAPEQWFWMHNRWGR